MSALTDYFVNWRDRLPRKTVSVALILLLLVAEWFLPTKIIGFGMGMVFFLVGGALLLVLGVRVWPALLVLLCYAPFAAYLRFAGFSNLQSLFKDLFALGIFGLWALGALVKRQKLIGTPLDLPILLFVLLGALNVLRAPTLLRGALAFKIFFTYVPIYFLVVQCPPSRKQLRGILWALLVVGALAALYGLFQYTQGSVSQDAAVEATRFDPEASYAPTVALSNWRGGQIRAFSTFGHAGVFALFLAMCLALGLGLERTASGWGRVALGAILLPLAAAVPTTLTRVGWIGVLLAVLTLFLVSSSGSARIKLLVAVALLILVFSLAGPVVESTLSWTGSAEDTSFQTRPQLLFWAARMTFIERPEGCGMGVLPDAAALASRVTKAYQPPNTCFWRGHPLQSADTVVFSIGVQMGALGVLLYLWIFVLIWKHGLGIYCQLSDPFLKGVAAGILGYLSAMTFANFLAGSPSAYPVVDFYFWLFVGVLMSLKRIQETVDG
jgi:hypothetical protein